MSFFFPGREPWIQLAISDDGLYTAVNENDSPDSLIAVFETEHLLCPDKWADPGDPYPESINLWEHGGAVEEIVFSPDGQAVAVRWWEGNGVYVWPFRTDKIDTYGTYTHVPISAFAFLGNKKVVVGRGNEIEVLDLEPCQE